MMPTATVTYNSEKIQATAMAWGEKYSIDVDSLLLIHIKQIFSSQDLFVLDAKADGDLLIFKLKSNMWQNDKEICLTTEGTLFW